jgi:GntR family transcriptional regulator, rspAB operon transcriptional repressor
MARAAASRALEPRLTQKERAAAVLREAILDERYPPGSWMRLRDVASELGTSTMPIREALQVLASEGLVAFYPHRGAQVSPLSVEGFEELYMARLGLEGLAARLGAEHIQPDDLAAMRDLNRQMEAAIGASDLNRFLDLDLQFHAIHYAAAQRPRLAQRIQALKRLGTPYTRRARLTLARTEYTRDFHLRLLEACATHDGELAERLLREDLDFTVRYLREVFQNAEVAHPTAPRNRRAATA